MVVAADARVQRHHQPVVAGHPGHLQHHVPAERGRLGARTPGRSAPRSRCAAPRPTSSGSAIASGWLWSAETAPCSMKYRRRSSSAGQVAVVVADVDLRRRAEALDGVRPARRSRAPGSGPGGRSGSPGSVTVGSSASACVRGQVVGGVVGGGHHVDAEPAQQRAGPVGPARPAARRSGRTARRRCPRSAAPVTPKISPSSLSNQYRTGVPRNRCQFAHSSRHASRARSSGSGPSPTPSRSRDTPLACSSRVT